MALQTLTIDPAATSYSDNDIVSKVNGATNQITRVDALDYDALNIVTTGPPSGHFKVKKVNVDNTNKVSVVYDDVAIP